ncbi:insulinase family protein [Pseudomonas moraviensis subsp. stanleyae]|uniref:M16 family metallopeptidase n=1 Tax=Pseudomonas moraviensis TaxID=321662 RepID=UPI002E318327|nr:pitrilysin family protein [Pseudomonas moraviensis]MED7668070.1 insulinase family protein [Pseudomonas moraviensis subsp. stanleyae]
MDTLCSRMLLFLGLAPFVTLAATPAPTHQFTLDNGLQVLIREDHRAPLVTSHLWFKVGSADEAPGQSGLSHVLEHMLYKGSGKTCADEASRILESVGAEENAFTRADVTGFHQTLAPRYLGVVFELMADLMSTAHLHVDDLNTELAVIREERHLQIDDDVDAAVLEHFTAQAHFANSYRTPVIGWMHDLQQVDAEELRHWYQSRYAPANAVLVIVGDITLAQVQPLAERYFGTLAKRPVPRPLRPVELQVPGERKLTLQRRVPAEQLLMAFNVPGLATAEDPHTVHALRLINAILGGASGARLQKKLIFTERVFNRLDTYYNERTRGDSLLLLIAELADPPLTDLEGAQARVWEQIESLRTTPPSVRELERARTQLIAQQVYARDSIQEQARQLATLQAIGLPWRMLDEDAEALAKVTPAQIREVAATWLIRERLSVAHVHKVVADE